MKTKDRTYVIKKGKHKSKPCLSGIWCGKAKLEWTAFFSKDMWYPIEDVEYTGVNKLFGASKCLHEEKPFGKWSITKNMVNSLLIGWQPDFTNKGTMRLYWYLDIKGKEQRIPFASVKLPFDINIQLDPYGTQMDMIVRIVNSLGGFEYDKSIESNGNINFGYFIKPYFGGRSKAPKEFKIPTTFRRK